MNDLHSRSLGILCNPMPLVEKRRNRVTVLITSVLVYEYGISK
jgi:hypothetical protein